MELQFSNTIIIVVDALRFDRVRPEIMPNTWSLAQKGIFFKHAYTVSNATDPSLTSIYTGLYPLAHGLIHHGEHVTPAEIRKISKVLFLQEILQKHGFRTIAIDFLSRWHQRGFNEYLTPVSRIHEIVKRIGGYITQKLMKHLTSQSLKILYQAFSVPYTAELVSRQALKILHNVVKEGNRFFILIHFWDTHTPYTGNFKGRSSSYNVHAFSFDKQKTLGECLKEVNGPWKQKLYDMFGSDTPIERIIARYNSAAYAVDRAIGKIVKVLEDLKIDDDTLLVIMSDHGESLGEHNIWFDHHGLYEVTIKIPLIMYSPMLSHKVIEVPVQSTDLFPTILKMLGINTKIKVNGIDLSDYIVNPKHQHNERVIYAEESYTERKFCVKIGKYKYIMALHSEDAICRYCNVIHGGIEELYDIEKDPEETTNIIHDYPDIARDLRKRLLNVIKRSIVQAGLHKAIERLKTKDLAE